MGTKGRRLAAVAVAGGLLGAAGLLLAKGEPLPPGPPALRDASVPSMPRDTGTGERLLLVVGGSFRSLEEAEAESARLHFGEIQGFYVVPVDQFLGLRAEVGRGARYVLASAFRTLEGAEQFAAVAEEAGADPSIVGRVVSRGGVFAGLGQEPAPDGTGPLTHPVPASRPLP